MRRALLLLLLLLVACATAPADQTRLAVIGGPRLVPVYDWEKDKTLTAFRSQMLEVIRARDERRLFDHLDSDVRISFGPGSGFEAFKRAWYIKPHWEELFTIFYMGGGVLRDHDHFEAPSIHATWPQRLDPSSFEVVLSRSTPLRESRDANSKTLGLLSFNIVKPLGEKGHVRAGDGSSGWVDPTLLWSAAGFRVELVRKRGTWKIAALVDG